LEPIQASEYRKGRQKLVQVKSGAHFLVRKMPPETVIKLLRAFGINIPASETRKTMKSNISEQLKDLNITDKLEPAMRIILPDCTVDPKIVLEGNPKGNELLLSEIDPLDAFDLLDAEMLFSGIGEESQAERESFRKK